MTLTTGVVRLCLREGILLPSFIGTGASTSAEPGVIPLAFSSPSRSYSSSILSSYLSSLFPLSSNPSSVSSSSSPAPLPVWPASCTSMASGLAPASRSRCTTHLSILTPYTWGHRVRGAHHRGHRSYYQIGTSMQFPYRGHLAVLALSDCRQVMAAR